MQTRPQKNHGMFTSVARQSGSFFASAGKRRALLVGCISLGMVGSAWTLSRWPTRYRAEATFTASAAVLPVAIDATLREQTLDDLGPLARSRFGEFLDSTELDFIQTADGERTIVVQADGSEPALAQRLALAMAERCRHRGTAMTSKEVSVFQVNMAEQKYQLAERRYRQALTELGEQESSPVDPWVRPTQAITSNGAAGEPLPTTPALTSSGRSSEETLVDATLRDLTARRERFARLYTEEHPAVISLDRQIAHLQAEMQAGGPAVSERYREAEDDIRLAAAQELTASVEFLRQERNQAKAEWETQRAKMAPERTCSSVSPGPGEIRYVGLDRRFAFMTTLGVLCALGFLVDWVCKRSLAVRS